MKRGGRIRVYVAVGALLAVCGLAAILFYRARLPEEAPAISARFSGASDAAGELSLYWDGEGYYAFFPAYAKLDAVTFRGAGADGALLAAGERLPFGEPMDLTRFSGDDLAIVVGTGEKAYPLRVEQSANLAAMFITTESGSTDYIHASKENKEAAAVVCVDPGGNVDSAGEITIKCHGNATFSLVDKKSYQIKFKKHTSLLGMEPAKKWIVQGNVFDSSKVRNRVSYYLADELGLPFAVRTEYIDLYVNGEYRGNYMAQDSVNVARNRVDIPEKGSFLIVADWKSEDEAQFVDKYGLNFTVKHPKGADEDTVNEIRNYINEVERRIDELKPEESLDELERWLDIDTFAIMYLVDELTSELDTNERSTYYYYSNQDRLFHAGPAWDFDRSLGNQWNAGRYYEVNAFPSGFPEQLWSNREFRLLVRQKLEQHPDLLDDALNDLTASAERIAKSVKMDSLLWGSTTASKREVVADNYRYNVEYVKWYVQKRFALIEDVVFHPEDYCNVYIGNERSGRAVWVRKGEPLTASQLDFLRELYGCDGFALSSGTPIWDGFPIFDDIILTPIYEPDTESAPAKGGVTGMDLLIFIILFAPGLLALFISGEYRIKARRDILLIVMEYGIYSFAALLFTYAVMFVAKGATSIGWGTGLGYNHPMSNINVAFRVMLLQLVGSVAVGLCARLYFRTIRPRIFPD